MYPILNITIPQEKRKEINAKILHIIDNNITNTPITKEIMFNCYTGEGALHGLNYNEFNNYHEFSNAKKKIELGQFFTPLQLSKFITDFLKPSHNELIADLTAGHGSLINFLPNKSNIYANEYELRAFKVLRYLFPECNLSNEDIRVYKPKNTLFDIVLGNPPYNIKLDVNGNVYNSQYYYMLKAHELLKPAGILVLIVPKTFLSDDFIESRYTKEINRLFNHVQTFILPFDTFKSAGANIETKIMIFQKKSEYIPENPYNTTTFETLTNFIKSEAERIYNNYIKPLYEQKEKVRGKLLLETNRQQNDDKEFQFKVKKLLFDIKRTKKTAHLYGKAEAYVMQYYTQKQPEGMKYEEWQKKRITKNKVISYLKRILKNQHNNERDELRLVKTKYGLKMKAYSRKSALQLSKMDVVKEMSFNDMILNNSYPFEDQTYKKLFERKKKEYEKQSKLFSEIQEDPYIKKWLDDFTITDSANSRLIKLNDIQKQDINKILQKRYSFLQWDTGTGKSLAAIAYAQYHLQHKTIHNAFIVAPAIAITGTFELSLESYGIDFVNIRSLKDIESIKDGQIVIITFNMLFKYQRQLKKLVKIKNNKIAVIIDESDNICNIKSKRSQATFNVFSKAKYKLLTTATSVRNSIQESFAEFSFLYKQSINFINYCPEIYIENTKTKEIESKPNPYYLKPYPMYTKGLKLFKECHNPNKQTVFGVSQNTQHIYQAKILKDLINKTIITRTFEDVTGRSISKMIHHTCKFNESEYKLYKKIVEEFYQMGKTYITGNARKDALLQIIAQLNMLIRCCSASHLFKECAGNGVSEKFKKVFSLIREWQNEFVVIGCRFKKTVYSYAHYLKKEFPDRKVFVITGEDLTIKQRKKMIDEMKRYKGAILVCTQQSLSSSISINFIDKIIISENGWNSAILKQFYARFIRFDSESDNKEIHFVSYENSIESNLLKLILTKENFNLFMKNQEMDEEELYSRFGIDFDLINMLMTKEYDSITGKSYMRWGDQKIV